MMITMLKGVKISAKDTEELTEQLSNWMKISKSYDDWPEDFVLKAIKFELDTKNRHDIVSRLRKKLEVTRAKRENEEFQAFRCESV